MTNRRLRLLYMGNLFPPGWAGRHVSLHHYCGDIFLWQKLSQFADVSTVGLLPGKLWKKRFEPKDDSPGLEHELLLWDRNPALWHRWISWRKLRRYYLEKVQREGMPDALVIYNLQHVFNHFVKWLRRQPRRPLIVLRIGDSGGLGEKIPLSRRLRYKFKPMQMLEAQSVLMYDACIISSLSSRRYFEPRGVPWMWHPTVYRFEYHPPPFQPNQNGPIRFGYFGTLSNGAATFLMVRAFLKADVPGTLHVCGYGPLAGELEQLAGRHPNFHFDGFLPKESDCLDWAQKVDVLINPRSPIQGQDNSFPSKILEYGIAGKAILSTLTAGVDEVLGKEGLYFDAENFEESLPKKIREVSAMDRAELQRRAQVIRNRIVKEFSPDEQARRVFEFLARIVESRSANQSTAPALSVSVNTAPTA
jgi:glycosyltransferase involved in cell wall biosynthesis